MKINLILLFIGISNFVLSQTVLNGEESNYYVTREKNEQGKTVFVQETAIDIYEAKGNKHEGNFVYNIPKREDVFSITTNLNLGDMVTVMKNEKGNILYQKRTPLDIYKAKGYMHEGNYSINASSPVQEVITILSNGFVVTTMLNEKGQQIHEKSTLYSDYEKNGFNHK